MNTVLGGAGRVPTGPGNLFREVAMLPCVFDLILAIQAAISGVQLGLQLTGQLLSSPSPIDYGFYMNRIFTEAFRITWQALPFYPLRSLVCPFDLLPFLPI